MEQDTVMGREPGVAGEPGENGDGRVAKCQIFHDNFANRKSYNLPKADLIIADPPYNLGADFNGSRREWYVGGDIKNGEDKTKARRAAFPTDYNFNLAELIFHISRMLKKEEAGKPVPSALVFCAFQQAHEIIELAKAEGLKKAQVLYFVKPTSAAVLKANQKACSAMEIGLLLYRDRLPYFNNIDPEDGARHMILDHFDFIRDKKSEYPKIHPTQKPVALYAWIYAHFAKPGDKILDTHLGSGSSRIAAYDAGLDFVGYELDRDYYEAQEKRFAAHVRASKL